jgi:glycosyltransferase involved in cell wall biosynthesis
MLVEFIIPTYNRLLPLKCMLASLTAQTNSDWGAMVMIDNNVPQPHIHEMVEEFKDPRIRCVYMTQRYNDWGHTPRQHGKQLSVADYIIMTGDDNYYTPNFVEEIQKVVTQFNSPAMIYWDMVHSHFDYSYFKCRLSMGQIDMGAFATRRDVAHAIPLGTHYAADGFFIEEYKERFSGETVIKIDKVLFVHN